MLFEILIAIGDVQCQLFSSRSEVVLRTPELTRTFSRLA